MASDSSPVCFRLPAEERRLMEAVALYQGRTLSAFVREAATATAASIIRQVGADTLLEAVRQTAARRANQDNEQLKGLEEILDRSPQVRPQH